VYEEVERIVLGPGFAELTCKQKVPRSIVRCPTYPRALWGVSLLYSWSSSLKDMLIWELSFTNGISYPIFGFPEGKKGSPSSYFSRMIVIDVFLELLLYTSW